jgi:hypothetical protein
MNAAKQSYRVLDGIQLWAQAHARTRINRKFFP